MSAPTPEKSIARRVLRLLLPHPVRHALSLVYLFALLARSYLYDLVLYARWGALLRTQPSRANRRAIITMEYHRIEKGLALPQPRPGFGAAHLHNLLAHLRAYAADCGEDETTRTARKALAAYRAFNRQHGHAMPGLDEAIDRALAIDAGDAEGGTHALTREAIHRHGRRDLDDFFASRFSVRQFSGEPVDPEQIRHAVRLATRTPSVCNRQGWRVRALRDPAQRDRVLALQNGTRGFGHTIDTLLVVSADLECFISIGERNQGWIDGGMFAMTLIWALHAQGLGTCALNWSVDHATDRALRRELALPGGERVLMLIAVGHLPGTFRVACSARRGTEDILLSQAAPRMRPTPTLLFSAVTTLTSRGVGALVNSLSAELRARHPTARLVAMTEDPERDRGLATGGLALARDRFASAEGRRRTRWAARLALHGLPPSPGWRETIRHLREADLILVTGGDVFSSDYTGFEGPLNVLRMARRLGTPYFFLAQSVGPFRTDAEAASWREVAADARAITVRETLSYRYVTETLGLPSSQVTRTADPAFLLEPAPGGDALASRLGLAADRPVIGLAPSRGITGFTGGAYEAHLRAWTHLITSLLERTEAQALIVPHVQDPNPHNDDRRIVADLMRALGNPARVACADGAFTPNEYKALLGRCDLVVAERVHAAVAGLSSGVCTAVVGYSVKAEGILADFDAPGDDAARPLRLPFATFLRDGSVEEVVGLWNRRARVADRLRERLPEVRRLARLNFDIVDAVLRDNG